MALTKERYVVEDKLFIMIMQVSRFVGSAPVRLTKTHTYTIMYISRWLLMCAILSTTICNVVLLYDVLNKIINTGNFYQKFAYLEFWLGNAGTTMLLVNRGVFCGVSRMRNFMYCIDQIQTIKKRYGSYNECNIKTWRIYSFIFIYFGLFCTVGSLDFWVYNEWDKIRYYITFFMSFNVILIEFQFIAVVISINSAFEVINKTLQENLVKIRFESEIPHTGTYDLQIPVKCINRTIDVIGMAEQLYPDIEVMQRIKEAQNIRQVTHSFVTTSEALRKLISSESFALLLLLAILTSDLSYTIYNLLRMLHDIDNFFKFTLKNILEMLWFVYHIIRILLLAEPCYRTQEKVSSTRFLVSNIMCYVGSEADPLRDEIDDFFKQLKINNVSYSAKGLCNICRPLIFTIIGSVTTIIVFLYQL